MHRCAAPVTRIAVQLSPPSLGAHNKLWGTCHTWSVLFRNPLLSHPLPFPCPELPAAWNASAVLPNAMQGIAPKAVNQQYCIAEETIGTPDVLKTSVAPKRGLARGKNPMCAATQEQRRSRAAYNAMEDLMEHEVSSSDELWLAASPLTGQELHEVRALIVPCSMSPSLPLPPPPALALLLLKVLMVSKYLHQVAEERSLAGSCGNPTCGILERQSLPAMRMGRRQVAGPSTYCRCDTLRSGCSAVSRASAHQVVCRMQAFRLH